MIKFCERYQIEKTPETCERCRKGQAFRESLKAQAVIPQETNCQQARKVMQAGGETIIDCSLHDDCVNIRACANCDREHRIFNVGMSSNGLGDLCCALYVLEGIRKKYPKSRINFFTGRMEFAKIIEGVEFLQLAESCAVTKYQDCFYGYNAELRSDDTRKDWYARPFSVIPEQPKLAEAFTAGLGKPYFDFEYIALSPFSYWSQREWPLSHWLYLESLLAGIGIKCVILDGPGNPARHSCFRGMRAWGLPIPEVCLIIHHARLVVGNDSGIAHLAGLLKKKTLAIISHIPGERLFSYTGIEWITASKDVAPCVGCSFRGERGFWSACDKGCFALQAVTPFMVFERIKKMLGETK